MYKNSQSTGRRKSKRVFRVQRDVTDADTLFYTCSMVGRNAGNIQWIFAGDNIVWLLHRFRNIATCKYAFICNLTARYSIYRVQFTEISFCPVSAAWQICPRPTHRSYIVAAFYICNANKQFHSICIKRTQIGYISDTNDAQSRLIRAGWGIKKHPSLTFISFAIPLIGMLLHGINRWWDDSIRRERWSWTEKNLFRRYWNFIRIVTRRRISWFHRQNVEFVWKWP